MPTIEYNSDNDNKYFSEQQLSQLQRGKHSKITIVDETVVPIDESGESKMEYFTE